MPKLTRSHTVRHLIAWFRSNYWLVPSATILACVGLAYLMTELDTVLPEKFIIKLGWVYTRDPAGARSILAVVSESMITVAGVVFSITVVALTLASSQFGTRVLKSFARDSGNQFALGTLLGTFLYGVLVLRRVQSPPHPFVPSLSVAVSIFLAIASVVVLVFFIHHVIVEIQAESIVAEVARDLYDTIDEVFPEDIGHGGHAPQPPPTPNFDRSQMRAVRSRKEGVIRSIDSGDLMRLALQCDAIVEIVPLPGSFVTAQSVLARYLAPPEAHAKLDRKLPDCFDIGVHRTYEQDLRFAFDQLALITTRSLSPAINAVGTAEDAVRWLKAGLIRLGQRQIPSPYRYDDRNQLRIITRTWDLSALLGEVFDPIRQSSQSLPAFVFHTIEALGDAARCVKNPALRDALAEQIRRFADTANGFSQRCDRDNLRTAAAQLLQSISERK